MYYYNGKILESPVFKIENEWQPSESVFKDEHVTFYSESVNYNDVEYKPQVSNFQDEKKCMYFNGEILNYKELHSTLLNDGHEFTSESETEVISVLYDKYKEEMFQYLRGKFSIVIWDRKRKVLIGARDHFGIKPLFYQETADGMLFSSDKKGIVNQLKKAEVNCEGLQHYLSFQFVPEPITMTEGIKKVEPGHYFIKKPGEKLKFKAFWKATFEPVSRSKEDWIKRIQDVMYDSVQLHVGGDLPIGSLLSGGIDSTIIVAMAKEFIPNIKTFSVGFERTGYSEVDVAEKTADELNVENISYIVSPEEYIEELPKIIWHMDDPLADPSCVPLYFVTREARKHVSVLLSGEGSDELFGGYNIYNEPNSLKIFDSIPKFMMNILAKISTLLPDGFRGKSFLERGTTPLNERYIGNAKMFEEKEKKILMKDYNEDLSYHDITSDLFYQAKDYPLVNQMQYVDIHTWLRGDILLKANQMTMANSIELRTPFLDKEVFRVASEIPVDFKINNGTTKYILREAVQGIVPDHILNRRKLGFPVPMRHWLKDELNSWAKQLIHESETDHLINKSYIIDLLNAHCQGKVDYSRKIWTTLMFMLWHQIFIEHKYDFETKKQSELINN
ncbi:MAG: asparagine synthase (glutamine-hydrolyzing) [Erysipelothrix sp.]|nr:asparagine synthase (glutamine-hydrolyzing) [Erysipelothrix sp.]